MNSKLAAFIADKRTPVWMEFATPAGAEAFVRRSLPEVVASYEVSGFARFLPVARLRADQEFLRNRLEERGIKCYVDEGTVRHVSDLMVQVGAEELAGRIPGISIEQAAAIARSVYNRMEAKR